MSLRFENELIYLEGNCTVEDAEHLLAACQDGPRRKVDVTRADHLHTATVQVLFAMRPQIVGHFADDFQSRWLAPLLIHATGG